MIPMPIPLSHHPFSLLRKIRATDHQSPVPPPPASSVLCKCPESFLIDRLSDRSALNRATGDVVNNPRLLRRTGKNIPMRRRPPPAAKEADGVEKKKKQNKHRN
ncbi:hypothetical protein L596_023464 [Steinernema carpocapsae]|uniref:Uncharacterized protein n=1 Tax=Steinernema carpocapsae TaxID=34508 RepID=A0A4U5MDR9_STECR|nr:hypothetical protein L596_023464 [Steinernema carpocapsae]